MVKTFFLHKLTFKTATRSAFWKFPVLQSETFQFLKEILSPKLPTFPSFVRIWQFFFLQVCSMRAMKDVSCYFHFDTYERISQFTNFPSVSPKTQLHSSVTQFPKTSKIYYYGDELHNDVRNLDLNKNGTYFLRDERTSLLRGKWRQGCVIVSVWAHVRATSILLSFFVVVTWTSTPHPSLLQTKVYKWWYRLKCKFVENVTTRRRLKVRNTTGKFPGRFWERKRMIHLEILP